MPWLSLRFRAPRRRRRDSRPARPLVGNVADRYREHNRAPPVDSGAIALPIERSICDAVEPWPPLIWPFSSDMQDDEHAGARNPAVRTAATEGNMTTFDKREEGFEKKFAHDEELRF